MKMMQSQWSCMYLYLIDPTNIYVFDGLEKGVKQNYFNILFYQSFESSIFFFLYKNKIYTLQTKQGAHPNKLDTSYKAAVSITQLTLSHIHIY